MNDLPLATAHSFTQMNIILNGPILNFSDVGTAGPDHFVTNVYGTPGVNMVHVMNPGLAIVKKAGVVFSATKT